MTAAEYSRQPPKKLEVEPTGKLNASSIVRHISVDPAEDARTKSGSVKIGWKYGRGCNEIRRVRKITCIDANVEAHILANSELP